MVEMARIYLLYQPVLYGVYCRNMTDLMIKTKGLRKVFKGGRGQGVSEVVAVKGLSFEVKRGEIFGFLGPNGAGKTTTMRMLSTLLTPTEGEVHIAGLDLNAGSEEIRRRIGYVSQVGGMMRELSGIDNLIFQGRLYGMSDEQARKRAEELLKLFDLESYASRPVGTYSGGQKRIFDLASGIIHNPQLLFLDEPSTGLDPQNRAHVWDQVRKLHKDGTTVFLTTHYLDEAEALCDRVAIMDKGEVVAHGTPEELKQKYEAKTLDEVFLKITGHILWTPEN
jgi:ABC-2 type transport system ATP-binding protein